MNRRAPPVAIFIVSVLATGLCALAFWSGDRVLIGLALGGLLLCGWNFKLRRKSLAQALAERTSPPQATFRVTSFVYVLLIASFIVPIVLMWLGGWLERPYVAFVIVVAWVGCFAISSSLLVLYRELGPGGSSRGK